MKDDMRLEMIAGRNVQLEHIEDYLFEVSESNDDNIRHIKFLKEQNSRLQSELDKQIKDNRKLVEALKKYADTEPYVLKENCFGKQCLDIRKIAQDVLKEIGEE